MTEIKSPKKLIEVALPLDDINLAAAKEKSIRHGHPSTLHLWWARRPLAAARAVIFAQMVNDPGYQREIGYGVNKKEAELKREKLFDIIRELVKWENTNNEEVLNRARQEIWESWRETCHLNRNHPQAADLFDPEKLPAFHDPFAGGGAIPLEGLRLGLESYATDLNPVAVMINKAMIEIPPRFAGLVPVGPLPKGEKQPDMMADWSGTRGLAEDVRRYGNWMREEALKRIGHLYPKVKITSELASQNPQLKAYEGMELTVIAWLWARTVNSPSPAFSHVQVPLVSSFVLSSKKGAEYYVEPNVDGDSYKFSIRKGICPDSLKKGTKVSRANFSCLLSDAAIDGKYVKKEASEGRLGKRLMAMVALAGKTRVYLPPECDQSIEINEQDIQWKPNQEIKGTSQYLGVKPYGLDSFYQLFTPRQLVALNTYVGLIEEVKSKVAQDAIKCGLNDDQTPLANGGYGCTAYAEAVAVYLSFGVSRLTDICNALCRWEVTKTQVRNLFGRQAIPMIWDFAENNLFAEAAGDFKTSLNSIIKVIERWSLSGEEKGNALHDDAQTQNVSCNKVVSTDPPYYDNVPYADLSDFFYVWMRRMLKGTYPQLFSTMSVPKLEELVAFPHRHEEGRDGAEAFFLDGMSQAMNNISKLSHPCYPVTIYYAFKQGETTELGTSSTGWETFLEAVTKSGLEVQGTWPMRTELANRMRGSDSNALASSIVLVCRKRLPNAEVVSRRQFIRELREDMPEALEAMIGGTSGSSPIAPVDLAQSAIGPGMAIFSKYEAVLNQDGSRMSIHDALILINRAITEYLNPDSGNFDADTLFCDDWFAQYGWSAGNFGEADTLSRAKGTSVEGVKYSGVIESGGGKVRLLKWTEYPSGWDPKKDSRTPVWEACHQMIRVLNQHGESSAGDLLARMPEQGEPIRQLAYHLYTLCERKKWAEEARAYNELIGSWHAIIAASHEAGHKDEQIGLEF